MSNVENAGIITGGATGAAVGTLGLPVVGTIAGGVVGAGSSVRWQSPLKKPQPMSAHGA